MSFYIYQRVEHLILSNTCNGYKEIESKEEKDTSNYPGSFHNPLCLTMFLVNNMTSFDYYNHDQTINARTCCTIFFHKIYECSS